MKNDTHTSHNNSAALIISTLLFSLVFAGVMLYATTVFANLKSQQIDNEARFQCAQSSRYSTVLDKEKGVEVWYPVADLYTKCLTEKGIQ